MNKGERWYDGKYLQGSLSDEVARALVNVHSCESVESLKHIIRNVPSHTVQDMIDDYERYETEHGSIEGFSKDYGDLGVGELRDAQTVGVAFMYYAESALLGDEVGLGKTVQVAGLCNLLKMEAKKKGESFRYCFLTEKTSIHQIRKKMIQFTGEYVEELESGEQKVVQRYIKGYEKGTRASIVGGHSLLNSSEFLIHSAKHPFDLLIIDESSLIKNTSSDVYKNCKAIFKFHKRKILLNATPLEQCAEEFYNQLDLLDESYLMSREAFKSRYCVLKKKNMLGYEVVGYKNTEEFKEAISLRYLARTRVVLEAKYEDNKYQTVLVPLSKEQKELMKKTTLYSMVNDYPTGVSREVKFNIETTPKAAALIGILKKIDVVNSKSLVYCRYKECQNALVKVIEEVGYRVVILNGDTKIKERNAILSGYAAGEYDVLITNVLRGLDLNNCDNTILYSIDPNPQKMVQFEGRMTRELDIIGKSLYLLVSMGKEKKFVEEKLKMRVEASENFTETGRSMLLAAVRERGNITVYKGEGSEG